MWTIRYLNFLRIPRPDCITAYRGFASRKAARRLAAQQRVAQSEKIAASRRVLSGESDAGNDSIGPTQNFRHFLVLDFEATCDHKSKGSFGPPEIIEFPALKVCARTFRVESTFHAFVRPVVNPILRPFCSQLTGMVQDDVDGAPTLLETLRDFQEWMLRERLVTETTDAVGDRENDNFAAVTCGDWDLGKMLPSECARLGVAVPSYLKSWINVKICFSNSHGKWPRGMQHMLDELKLPLQGRPHSGIDDCANLSNILKAIAIQKRLVYNVTSTYNDDEHRRDAVAKYLESFRT